MSGSLKSNRRIKIWFGDNQEHLDTRNQNKEIRGKVESSWECRDNTITKLKSGKKDNRYSG